MRWFRGHAEAPRLLSLSPLQAEEDLDGASHHSHAASQYRDMSPVRWVRRKSSSSDSERNCYNVQTSRVTTERAANKKDKKKIQEERRRICEKRNPLLDRVKNTRLSFFRDRDSDGDDQEHERDNENDDEEEENENENENENEEEEEDETESLRFRSMCELSRRGLSRNEFRRSVCESDLKDITEEEKTQARRKRRSKSQSRLPGKRQQDERFGFLGFRTTHQDRESSRNEESKPRGLRWRKNKTRIAGDRTSQRSIDRVLEVPLNPDENSMKDGSQFDSITPSSCLAAKFRAMQDRYLKTSTSRLIAKIYKKDAKDKERRRLRSFSYGALPGLEELRTNPLYEEQEQDDNDSGILDNDSATSSLLDDRCSSGASGLLPNNSLISSESSCFPGSAAPQLPPRRASSSVPEVDVDRSNRFCSTLDRIEPPVRSNYLDDYQRSANPAVYQAANSELIDRRSSQTSLDLTYRKKLPGSCRELRTSDKSKREESSERGKRECGLSVVRSRSYVTETMVVKLPRETADQCLGIFIAKTAESSPGYLVAHVVPNGLADKEGTLKIGDEILIVNGKRLRGLSMAEARKILGNGSAPGEVDIVVSRYTGVDQPSRKLKESSVDYENVSMENGHGVIIESPSRLHFRKNPTKRHRDKKEESSALISPEKSSAGNAENVGSTTPAQTVPNFCTLPRRPRSTVSTFHTVVFEKGPGKKSLGFTIVGGRDSPKGSIGIFIKSVLPSGQAAEDGRLRAGDEILAVNGQVCHDLTHREAVQLFRNIKSGPVALHLCRRVKNRETQGIKAKSCADLLLVDT